MGTCCPGKTVTPAKVPEPAAAPKADLVSPKPSAGKSIRGYDATEDNDSGNESDTELVSKKSRKKGKPMYSTLFGFDHGKRILPDKWVCGFQSEITLSNHSADTTSDKLNQRFDSLLQKNGIQEFPDDDKDYAREFDLSELSTDERNAFVVANRLVHKQNFDLGALLSQDGTQAVSTHNLLLQGFVMQENHPLHDLSLTPTGVFKTIYMTQPFLAVLLVSHAILARSDNASNPENKVFTKAIMRFHALLVAAQEESLLLPADSQLFADIYNVNVRAILESVPASTTPIDSKNMRYEYTTLPIEAYRIHRTTGTSGMGAIHAALAPKNHHPTLFSSLRTP